MPTCLSSSKHPAPGVGSCRCVFSNAKISPSKKVEVCYRLNGTEPLCGTAPEVKTTEYIDPLWIQFVYQRKKKLLSEQSE